MPIKPSSERLSDAHEPVHITAEDEARPPLSLSVIIANHLDHLAYERWLTTEFELRLGPLCVLQFIQVQPGHPVTEIAEALGFVKPIMTEIMQNLVTRGFLVRRRTLDRRLVICELTPEGGALLDRIEAALKAEPS